MQVSKLKDMLESGIEQSEVFVEGDGTHFEITVIADTFENLSTLQRQQTINRILAPAFRDGDIHAVSMKTYTKEEWGAVDG